MSTITTFSTHISEADKLLSEYGEEVRPILLEITNRLEKKRIPDNLANEIRALNDHIARCFIDGKDDEQIKKELGKAEGHLKRLEYDVYKQMNIFLHDKAVGEFSSRAFWQMDAWYQPQWASFKNQYITLRKEAEEAVNQAKLAESSGSDKDGVLDLYKEGYYKYRELEELIIGHEQDLNTLERQNKRLKIKKTTLKVLIAVFTAFATAVITQVICRLILGAS